MDIPSYSDRFQGLPCLQGYPLGTKLFLYHADTKLFLSTIIPGLIDFWATSFAHSIDRLDIIKCIYYF